MVVDHIITEEDMFLCALHNWQDSVEKQREMARANEPRAPWSFHIRHILVPQYRQLFKGESCAMSRADADSCAERLRRYRIAERDEEAGA